MSNGMMLGRALQIQKEIQEESYGFPLDKLSDEERIEYIRFNMLAALDELHEMLRETGWKRWKAESYGKVNRPGYVEELTDAIVFILNLALAVGITGEELSESLKSVWRKNVERQESGY